MHIPETAALRTAVEKKFTWSHGAHCTDGPTRPTSIKQRAEDLPETSNNWSGYQQNEEDVASNIWFSQFGATIPAVQAAETGKHGTAYFWSGIGEGETGQHRLYQDGFWLDSSTGVSYSASFWYEGFPGPIQQFKDVPARIGDKIVAQTFVDPQYHQLSFTFFNMTLQRSMDIYFSYTEAQSPEPAVEWIAEYPGYQSTNSSFIHFKPMTMTDCQYGIPVGTEGGIKVFAASQAEPHAIDMETYQSGTHLLSTRGPLNGGTFKETWLAYR